MAADPARPVALPGRPGRGPRLVRPRTLIAVALTLIAAVPVIDPLVPPTIHLNPMLDVALAMTAEFAIPRRTMLIGALAVAALAIAGIERSTLTTENVLVQLSSLALLSVLLAFFCRLRERRERELARLRLVSEAAQRVVLRPLPGRVGPVSLASVYHAAGADTHIGGDFFAAARTQDSTRLIIGDVCGKGLDSISEAAIMLESFRAAARQQLSLSEMVSYLESSALWGLREFSHAGTDLGERFVTLAVAEVPDNEPLVRLILCGHPSPLLLHQGTATVLPVPQPAPPLGLGSLFGGSYAPQTFRYAPGDVLLLYTDGVTEARDEQGTFYPLARRAAAWANCSAAQLVKNIEADLDAYVPGALGDDMAMVAVQRAWGRRADHLPSAGNSVARDRIKAI